MRLGLKDRLVRHLFESSKYQVIVLILINLSEVSRNLLSSILVHVVESGFEKICVPKFDLWLLIIALLAIELPD